MNTMINIRRVVLLVAVAFAMLAVAACVQINEENSPNQGEVGFGVEATYQSEVKTRSGDDGMIATRTEYSGLDENGDEVNSSSYYERINWLNTDGIEILCQQADGDKTANFGVTPGTASGNETNASIEPWDHKLYWGTGTHHFFGLYPSPEMTGAPSDVSITPSGDDAAIIHGTIPATQTVTVSGNELKPNMAYAYMYAATAASGGNVMLHFNPLVTTLRFTLTSQNAFPSGLTLTTIELSSTQTNGYLAGSFNATITDSGLTPLTTGNVTGGSNKITINVPSGVQLDTDQPLMFTFLTLPLSQSNMKLTLRFSDGSTKTLTLKTSSGNITVGACKKCYINDINLPWVYYLDVTPTISVNYLGATQQYAVTSYKQIGTNGDKYPVQWKATSYSVDGGTATSTKPAWLPTFTQTSTNPDGNPKNFNVKIAPCDRENPGIEALENATARGTQASPWDLSTHDINGNSISKTTANCYVITAPGWYKFPIAYGNAYKNGNANTDAYKHTLNSYNSHYLKNFKDSNDKNISSPDISGADGVQLIWQDAKDLVTVSDLRLDNGFIVFHIEKENICEGNAIIAAKKGTNTLWSWHIWVTPYVKSNVTIKGKTYMARNLGWCEGGTTTWKSRKVVIAFKQTDAQSNAGTKTLTINQTGNTEMVMGSSPHYQWGRKDPMIAPIGLTTATQEAANKIFYNASGVASQHVETQQGPQTLGYAIKSPQKMIYINRNNLPRGGGGIGQNGSGGWYADWTDTRPFSELSQDSNGWESDSHYCNLWNYNINKNGTNEVGLKVSDFNGLAHGKTVYDPCPIGYTIPTPYELANLATFATGTYLGTYTITNTNPGTFDDGETMKGYVLNGNLWSANGMRFYLTSDYHVGNVGRYGYWFSCAPYHSHFALSLLEYTPSNPDGNGNKGFTIDGGFAKGSARSIRCVPE